MNFLFLIAFAASGVWLCQGQTAIAVSTRSHHTHHHHTHGSGPTKEPAEKESFLFQYIPASHHMYIRQGHSCYVAALTPKEQTDVHTDVGIKTLEVKLLQMLSIATHVTDVNATLTKVDVHVCGHRTTHFFTIP